MPNEDDKKNDTLLNWKAESRLDWTTRHWGQDDAREVLAIGCLMRIAESLEQLVCLQKQAARRKPRKKASRR